MKEPNVFQKLLLWIGELSQILCQYELEEIDLRDPVRQKWDICNGVTFCKKCDKDFRYSAALILTKEQAQKKYESKKVDSENQLK